MTLEFAISLPPIPRVRISNPYISGQSPYLKEPRRKVPWASRPYSVMARTCPDLLDRDSHGTCATRSLTLASHSRNKSDLVSVFAGQSSQPKKGATMSKEAAEHHHKAAEHHDLAAQHHREAARHHEAGNHLAAAHHAHTAQGHLHHATDHAEEAAKLHVEHHGHKTLAASS